MFRPNHVLVTAVSGRNLIARGKSGKNDAFVVMSLGEAQVRTSIKEHVAVPVWEEQWELSFWGFDEFLGQIRLELSDIYETSEESGYVPRNRWYPLKGKSGKRDEHKYRGELELRLQFFCKPLGLGQPGKDRNESTLTIAARKGSSDENFSQKVASTEKRKMSLPASLLNQIISKKVNSAEDEVKRKSRCTTSISTVSKHSPKNWHKLQLKEQRGSLPTRLSAPNFVGTGAMYSGKNIPPSGGVDRNTLTPLDLRGVGLIAPYKGGRSFNTNSSCGSPLPSLREIGESIPFCDDSDEGVSFSAEKKDGGTTEELIPGLGITKEQRKQLRKQAAVLTGEVYEESPKRETPKIQITPTTDCANKNKEDLFQNVPVGEDRGPHTTDGGVHGSGKRSMSAAAIAPIRSVVGQKKGGGSQGSSFDSPTGSQSLGYNPLSVVNLDLVYDTLTKNDLIGIIKDQRKELVRKERKVRDLEQYIDNLLAKVLESNPALLSKPHPTHTLRHRICL